MIKLFSIILDITLEGNQDNFHYGTHKRDVIIRRL